MYKKVLFIGYGSLLKRCLELLLSTPSLEIQYLETEFNKFSSLSKFCEKYNVRYHLFTEKSKISEYIDSISEKTLVISIHNKYIFSKNNLLNDNLLIVNFHNSLLPKHAGRNAPSWSIFEQDSQAGITWHEVIRGIDKGDIIVQKPVNISNSITAIELTRITMDLGYIAFKEIYPRLLAGNYEKYPQKITPNVTLHLSSDVPNQGILDLDWDFDKISAFLRAFDLSIYPAFPKPLILFENCFYELITYNIKRNALSSNMKRTISFENYMLNIADMKGNINLTVKKT